MQQAKIVEGQQIWICRVLCIFFMMSVHVNPGLSGPSLISAGGLTWLGTVWVELLGRTSVAALSFISGYLLVRTAASRPLHVVAGRKLRTLIVPMLTWNLLFCALLVVEAILKDLPADRRLVVDPVAALTGLTGATANRSLFFLRDLFVSALIVRLLLPGLRRWPILLLGIAVVAVLDAAEPLVFRPAILLFVAAGAVAAQRVTVLADLVRPRLVLPAVVLLLLALALSHAGAHDANAILREARNIVLRTLLTIGALAASLGLVATGPGRWLARREKDMFASYLLHAPLIALLWQPWRVLVGGPMAASYLVFFLAAPVAAILAGQWVDAAADRLPPALQLAVRGRARRPAPAAPAAPVPAGALPDPLLSRGDRLP
ncbi:MAG TPA: acyltransferase family protein [Amaricoccus sp.]|nr:acyltransferase family protein [Amaricoccus sp.]